MKTDEIKEIQIDDLGRLCIFPENERFTLIYRSATEIHWDNDKSSLYSPKPREWSYLDWYKHIISLVKVEYSIDLVLTTDTKWSDIPFELKEEILALY